MNRPDLLRRLPAYCSRRAFVSIGISVAANALAVESDENDVRRVSSRVREFVDALRGRNPRTALRLFSPNAFLSPLMYQSECESFVAYEYFRTSKDRRVAVAAALAWYVRELGGKAQVFSQDLPQIEEGIQAVNDWKAGRFLIFRGSDASPHRIGREALRPLISQPRTYISVLPFVVGPCLLIWRPSARERWEIVHAETSCI